MEKIYVPDLVEETLTEEEKEEMRNDCIRSQEINEGEDK